MSNPFALLADDASDIEAAAPAPQAKANAAPATANKSSASAPAAARNAQTSSRGRGKPDYPSRGGPRRVYGADRNLPGADASEGDMNKDSRQERGAGQRGGRGSGSRGPRGGRGGRGTGGNRPMDRHSQTDRTDSHKQEHQGWGGDEGNRELLDENKGEEDALADASGVATPVNAGESSPAPAAAAAAEEAAPAEPEDQTKTYEQYLAERTKSLNVNLPLLEARQANEGADESQWKNAIAFTRKDSDEENYFGVAKESNKNRKRPQKEGKTYIEFEPRFERPSRGRGGERGRGGRGRGEGRGEGRGRGAPRGGRSAQQAAPVDTNDASAFPSLS